MSELLKVTLPTTNGQAKHHLANEHGAGVPLDEALSTHRDLHTPGHEANAQNPPDHTHDWPPVPEVYETFNPNPGDRLCTGYQVNQAMIEAIEELPLLGLLTDEGKRAIRSAINAKLNSYPRAEPALVQDWRSLPAAKKVEIIEAMGFTPMGDDHTADCPSRVDSGLRCNCVPEATVWGGPKDVEEFRGETWETRRAKRVRQIEAMERSGKY